jgi:hypothetical protein
MCRGAVSHLPLHEMQVRKELTKGKYMWTAEVFKKICGAHARAEGGSWKAVMKVLRGDEACGALDDGLTPDRLKSAVKGIDRLVRALQASATLVESAAAHLPTAMKNEAALHRRLAKMDAAESPACQDPPPTGGREPAGEWGEESSDGGTTVIDSMQESPGEEGEEAESALREIPGGGGGAADGRDAAAGRAKDSAAGGADGSVSSGGRAEDLAAGGAEDTSGGRAEYPAAGGGADMAARVAAACSELGDELEVIVPFSGNPVDVDILRRDFQTARDGNRLNDELMNAFVGTLVEDAPGVASLSAFLYAKLVGDGGDGRYNFGKVERWIVKRPELREKDLILMPVHHLSVEHWGAIAIRPRERAITYFDSLANNGRSEAVEKNMLRFAKDAFGEGGLGPPWRATTRRSPQQDNDIDCGVFALRVIMMLAAGKDIDAAFGPGEPVRDMRRWICATLLTRGVRA